jgi:hypothetical protein
MYNVCEGVLILETSLSLYGRISRIYKGKTYRGAYVREHRERDTQEVRMARTFNSLDNEKSFWFTRPSLLNLLRSVGFTTVLETRRLRVRRRVGAERITFVALKGTRVEGFSELNRKELNRKRRRRLFLA